MPSFEGLRKYLRELWCVLFLPAAGTDAPELPFSGPEIANRRCDPSFVRECRTSCVMSKVKGLVMAFRANTEMPPLLPGPHAIRGMHDVKRALPDRYPGVASPGIWQ
jgi:hypothetical protein